MFRRCIVPATGLAFLVGAPAGAQVSSIAVERYIGDGWIDNGYDPTALNTWRIYLVLDDDENQVTAVFGSSDAPLDLTSSDGAFHNDATFDSNTAPLDLTGVDFWTNQWDSYVTVDTTDASGDATALTPGFSTEIGDLAGSFTMTNGAWYVTPDDLPQGLADGGRVLVAQLTVDEDAEVTGTINAQLVGGAQYSFDFDTSLDAEGPELLLLDNYGGGADAWLVVEKLESLGYLVTLGPSSASFDGSLDLSDYEVVVIGGGELGTTHVLPPDAGQTALVEFVASGGGLVIGEPFSMDLEGDDPFESFLPIDTYDDTLTDLVGNPFDVDLVGSHQVMHDDVTTSFTMTASANDTEFNLQVEVTATDDAELFVTADSVETPGTDVPFVLGRVYQQGRLVWIGTLLDDTALAADDFAALLGNAVTWASAGGSGDASGDRLGRSVVALGDVDGDDVGDWIVSAPYADGDGDDRGVVQVRSGADGTIIHEIYGEQDDARFGWVVADAGDVNGDLACDFIVATPYYDHNGVDAGLVRIYDGATGGVLLTKRGKNAGDHFGFSVAGRVDVDNDDVLDLIVGAPRFDANGHNSGKVYVYSGATGDRIAHMVGEGSGDRLGFAVAGIGRVNADGNNDFAVSAPWADDGGPDAGVVYIVAGSTWNIIRVHQGTQIAERLGYTLSAAGRIDGDTRDDYVLGSPYADRGTQRSAGAVDVRSGADGSRIWRKRGQLLNERLGWSVAGGFDADGDGGPDIIAGTPWFDADGGADAGRISVWSGSSGSSIIKLDGEDAGDRYGHAAALVDDADDDGFADIVVGAPYSDAALNNAGRIYVHALSAGEAAAMAGDFLVVKDCDGDLDGDGFVDFTDVLLLVEGWAGPVTDVDGDGDTGPTDLISMLGMMGSCGDE